MAANRKSTGRASRSGARSSSTRSASSTAGKSARASGSTRSSSGSRSRSASSGRGSAHPLVNHDEIRRWVEERGGHPACVRGTGGKKDTGMIRIDFPDGPEPKLQHIEWCDWFDKFDEKNLALMVQEGSSRFNKLVDRGSVGTRARSGGRAAGRKTAPKTRTAGGR